MFINRIIQLMSWDCKKNLGKPLNVKGKLHMHEFKWNNMSTLKVNFASPNN